MVEFYKKEAITTFAELSSTFPDLYDSIGGLNYGRTFKVDGSSGTQNDYGFSSIKGGPNESKGYFRSKIADRPPFGSAKLKRMDMYTYVEDVKFSENSSITPNLTLYKVKSDSVPDSLTSGVTRLEANAFRGFGHLSVLTAAVNSYISDEEKFTGTDSAFSYSSQENFTSIGRKVFRTSGGLFLEVDDAYQNGYDDPYYGKLTKRYTRKKFSVKHTSFMEASDTFGERRKVLKLEKRSDGNWKNTDGDHNCYFKHDDIKHLIKGAHREEIDSDPSYNNQITTGNTFFDVVKHDRELMFAKGEDVTLVGTAISRFSTDSLLKGNGQAMQMYAYWEGDSDDEVTTSEGITKGLKDLYEPAVNPNRTNYEATQETFVSYGPVPFPAHMYPSPLLSVPFVGKSSTGTDVSDNEITNNSHGLLQGTPVTFPNGLGNTTFDADTSTGISGSGDVAVDRGRIYYVSETDNTTNAFRISTMESGKAEGNITLTGSDTSGKTLYSVNNLFTADYGTFSNGTIEIDLNLQNLEAALAYTSNSNDNISLVKRAFVITLGYYKPSTGDNLIEYVNKHTPFSALSDGDNITSNNTDYPFLGWSFFRTKTSGGHFLDGTHVVTSDNWLLEKDRKSSGTFYDIYIPDTTGAQAADTGVPTGSGAGVVPTDSYFTFKAMMSPCTGAFGDDIHWGLFDPKTDMPLPLTAGVKELDDYDNNGTTHFFGAHTRLNMWWQGRTGCDSGGTDFWTQTTGGGIDYFETGTAGAGGGPDHAKAIWPRYLTLWLTNFPNSGATTNDDDMLEADGGEESITISSSSVKVRRATTSSVFVDGIRFKDFNFEHSNATVPSSGYKTGEITIRNDISSITHDSLMDLYGWDKPTYNGNTTLCIGSDEQDDFLDASQNQGIQLHNFKTTINNNTRIPFHNVRASLTTDYDNGRFPSSGTQYTDGIAQITAVAGGESFYGNQARSSHLGGGDAHNETHQLNYLLQQGVGGSNGLIFGGVDENETFTGGTGSIDNFTNKGYIFNKGTLTSAADISDSIDNSSIRFVRRELIYTSARILRVADKAKGIYKVDTTEPLRHHEGDDMIAYLYGSAYRGETATDVGDNATNEAGGGKFTVNTSVKLVEILDSKHIQLEWNGKSNAGDDMIEEKQLPYLMLSPLKYWMFANIQNYEVIPRENTLGKWSIKNLNARSYSSASLTTTDTGVSNHYGTFGITYNEYLYKDDPSIQGSYENNWAHDTDDDESILDLRDYGYGAVTEENPDGGYLSKTVPKVNDYNQLKMETIFSVDSTLKAGDPIDFMLTTSDNKTTEVIFHNNLASGDAPSGGVSTNHDDRVPYLLTVFEDDMPSPPTLSVEPYDKDPYLPLFKYEAGADDAWYGFIILDTKPVNSQYHEAILHLPLNDKGSHGKHPTTVPVNKAFANNTDTGTTTNIANMSDSGQVHDIEGLAGNCMRFDGNNDTVSYNPSSGNTLGQLDASNEASLIIHCIPNAGISGNNKLITSEQFEVVMAETGVISAHIFSDTSKFVTLTSPAVTIDGETPTNIIVTFDLTLKSGNCKLYIDGKLVDQSGLIRASSVTMGAGDDSWVKNVNLESGTDAFNVGASSLSFDGRIEEVVVYKKCIYPVSPSNDRFVLDKNLTEISDKSPLSYSARLFMKDYHNIRGGSSTDVATSPSVSYRKAGFRLVD